MAGRFLSLFKPISRFLPEIGAPKRKVGFNEKLFWTAMVLVIYMVMTEIPLYGITGEGMDLSYLRVIFASKRGTLMELGIGPIVTGGLILQLLVGAGMIGANMSNPEDRALFTSASKTFSIILTAVQALAYIIGGIYGQLTMANQLIIFLQLLMAGVVIILLDELVQKGWGIGSGISLFIMAGVAQMILWDSFSPAPAIGEAGRQHGMFIALVQTLTGGQPLSSIFLRGANPSMIGFIATVAVFLVVIYFEGIRVELPISYAGYRGYRSRYPIKLLYVSNLPVIFASALFANVYFFSQLFWSVNGQPDPGGNFWLDLLGQYEKVEVSPGQIRADPIGGLVYFVIGPRNIIQVAAAPLRAVGYTLIMVAFCVIFSLTWLEVGGLGPSTVSRQLVDSGMQIPGYRRSQRPIESLLKRYIPAVTVLGGVVVGLIAAVGDFFGVFGSGMGILLSVGIIYQYYQLLMQERVAEMYPALRRFIGG